MAILILALNLLGLLNGLTWLLALAQLTLAGRTIPRMANLPDTLREGSKDADWPAVSIIIPACNEAERLQGAFQSVLDLDYPNLQIIAIDDRSEDATGRLLDEFAGRLPGRVASGKLKIIHVNYLPPGWLGKNHALYLGSQVATGEWLLFTDADVFHHRSAMRRAIAYAVTEKLDHLVALPETEMSGFWERTMMSAFTLLFSLRQRTGEVNFRRSSAFIGVGAFNLVSRAGYEKIGTHRRLALEVVDDLKLGKLVRRLGLHQKVVSGFGMIRVRWQTGLSGIIHGLMKNSFAGLNFNLLTVVGSVLALIFLSILPAFGIFLAAGYGRIGFAVSWLCIFILYAGSGRFTGAPAWYGLTHPLAGVVYCYIVIRSTYLALRSGGIEWRGTRYSLKELRQGLV